MGSIGDEPEVAAEIENHCFILSVQDITASRDKTKRNYSSIIFWVIKFGKKLQNVSSRMKFLQKLKYNLIYLKTY